MSKWAYEMDNETLINEFARACAQSGTANSGLIIDMMASAHAEDVRYLKGVLLSKLERVKPPFKRNDMVRSIAQPGTWRSVLPPLRNKKIYRIYYNGKGIWLLKFCDIPDGKKEHSLFNANDFVLESVADTFDPKDIIPDADYTWFCKVCKKKGGIDATGINDPDIIARNIYQAHENISKGCNPENVHVINREMVEQKKLEEIVALKATR